MNDHNRIHGPSNTGPRASKPLTKKYWEMQLDKQKKVPIKSTIFRGKTFFLLGRVNPSSIPNVLLHDLIRMHSGRVCPVYNGCVTHVVATNVGIGRAGQLMTKRRPPFIVRPEWLFKSMVACRSLPEFEYSLKMTVGQSTMDSFVKKPTPTKARKATERQPSH